MKHIAKALPRGSRSARPISPSPHASTSDSDEPVCPICKGSGYLREDLPLGHPRYGKLRKCVCKTGEDVSRLQELSGLTPSERQRRLSDIEVEGRPGAARMRQACAAFLAEPRGFLTLWGGVGNGKSMALHAVVNELIERGVQAVYITLHDLLENVRAGFNPRPELLNDDADQRLRRFTAVPVLALDEFDKVNLTPWARAQLTELMDKRSRLGADGQMGTLLAMNANPAVQLDWIASRLGDGRNRVVHNEDSDLRPALAR